MIHPIFTNPSIKQDVEAYETIRTTTNVAVSTGEMTFSLKMLSARQKKPPLTRDSMSCRRKDSKATKGQ